MPPGRFGRSCSHVGDATSKLYLEYIRRSILKGPLDQPLRPACKHIQRHSDTAQCAGLCFDQLQRTLHCQTPSPHHTTLLMKRRRETTDTCLSEGRVHAQAVRNLDCWPRVGRGLPSCEVVVGVYVALLILIAKVAHARRKKQSEVLGKAPGGTPPEPT